MAHLTPDECRVFGTLVEKAFATPAQYPLTLNALVAGCNQKSNRDPVTSLDEERVLRAIDGLKAKGCAREVALEGSRVPKFRQVGREALEVDAAGLVIIAELLLRGPQTVGELRGHASRLHPVESLEVAESVLRGLAGRETPLVRELSPSPGSRAARWMQLLCPELHPLDRPANPTSVTTSAAASDEALAARVEELERMVERLRRAIEAMGAAVD